MLPFLTLLSASAFAIENFGAYFLKKNKQLKLVLLIITFLFIIPQFNYVRSTATLNAKEMLERTADDLKMAEWVKKYTSKNEVFIVVPSSSFFYINYERPIFVSWKNAPQSADDMVEWYNRLKLLNKGEDFQEIGQVLSSYYKLTEKDIKAILNDYKEIVYFLTLKSVKLDFPLAYESSKHSLYIVRNPEKFK